jgi:hypothetical protein
VLSPPNDEYIRSGTVVVDRRGQQWIAMRMMTTPLNQSMWWRELEAQTFHPPTPDRQEVALDGKRFAALDELSGPLVIQSIPRRILGVFLRLAIRHGQCGRAQFGMSGKRHRLPDRAHAA